LAEQNKPGDFMCSSRAWAKPPHPHPFEFCEKGAKSTLWELTRDRCTPEFFGTQTIEALLHWQDYDLELQGRLTEPMHYDPLSDRYLRCSWDEAFAGIAAELRTLDPKSTVFYAGKASLETSSLYQAQSRPVGGSALLS
jgi:anaerobic selenocysteine-containing dehydrogenase